MSAPAKPKAHPRPLPSAAPQWRAPPTYAVFARKNGVPHYRIDAKNGPFVIDRAFHVQTINSLHDRFERFMKPFRGPATQNLTGYASWFIARSVRTEPERVEDAWDRLMDA